MRTWKNRQRPSKSHKKTVSRKQRGGGLLPPLLVQAWLTEKGKEERRRGKEDMVKLVNKAVSQGDANFYVQDELMETILQWEKDQKVKRAPLSSTLPFSAARQPLPLQQQQLDNPTRNFAEGLRDGTSLRGQTLRQESLGPFRSNAVNSMLSTPRPVGATDKEADAAADALLVPGAVTRLGTALSSANPLARRAPAAAPGASGLVYNMTGPSGKSQTVQDCNAQLAALQQELETLKSGVAQSRAALEAKEAALSAQIAELTKKNGELSATGEAAQEAIAALTQTGQTTAEQLDAASKALAGKGAELEDISARLAKTSAKLEKKKSLTVSQSEEIGTLKGTLEELARNSLTTEAENRAQITKLLTDHTAELERLKSEHLAELAKLQVELSTARADVTALGKASADEKNGLSDKIAQLNGAIAAQQSEIASLKSSLETATTSLGEAQVNSAKTSEEAAAAATAAAEAAARSAAELGQLQATNAELAQQLEAARQAATAAATAAAESEQAKNAAEAAVEAANALAETARSESEAAAAEAARAAADKTRSAGEKAEAQAAADKAKQDVAAAEAAARAAEQARNDALQKSQAAEEAKAQAEAKLAELKASTPKIILVYGTSEGDKVGGGDGRAVMMGETLHVRWQKGAEDSSAWVFVMFSNGTPAYTQLILKEGDFDFESTVAGDIKAVMFDVTAHSRGDLGF